MKRFVVTGVSIVALGVGVFAQQAGGGQQAPPPQPPASLGAEVQGYYNGVARNITASLDLVPADKWTWQPTPEVRSFARLFGHIVDDNNGACWQIAGLTAAPTRLDTPNSNESAAHKMSQADMKKALADSVELCGKAFAAITPANQGDAMGRRTKIGNLIYNTSHTNEHYGNLVTYLRLNNIVPPSSAGAATGRGRGAF